MQSSNIPTGVQLPFANSGAKQTIPVASQIGVTPGRASYTDGFPPLTRTAVIAGGIPPFGTDMNGILNAVTAIQQWQTAGASFKFDSTWSTANSGYPKGAILCNAQNDGYWISLAENNTTNPDAAANTAWAPISSTGVTTIALTNANVTLTPDQYAQPIVLLTGTLTGNVQLNFPAVASQWLIVNNTTGAFSVTAKTASGSGIVVPQGLSTQIYGDATNIGQAGIGAAAFGQQQLITVSGSFTVPAGVTQLRLTGAGGGSGGGGGGGNASTGAAGGGGGGGQGQQTIKQLVTVTPGQVLTVTIGAAGNGASGGTNAGTSGATGGNGGTTSVTGSSPAVSVSLAGGSGGVGGVGGVGAGVTAGGNGGASGAGGSIGGGQTGGTGTTGGGNIPGFGGTGGGTLFGSGGNCRVGTSGGGGSDGYGYGAGGSGGSGGAASAAAGGSGGNGAAGAVLLEW